MKRVTIIETISYLYILLFLYAGLSKLIEQSVFEQQIAATPLFTKISPIIAWMLPIVEIIVSLLLFWPKSRMLGFYSALLLMTSFIGYIFYILKVDEKLPCSCGGVIEFLSWKEHLIFNGLMIVLALLGILLLNKKENKKASSSEIVYN